MSELKVGMCVVAGDGSYGVEVTKEGCCPSSIAYPPIASKLNLMLVATNVDFPADSHKSNQRNDCVLVDKNTGRVFFHQLRFLRQKSERAASVLWSS